jgi:hypothetical protein
MWFGCTWRVGIPENCLALKFPTLIHIRHFIEVYLDGELHLFSLIWNAQLGFNDDYDSLLISDVSPIELLLIINSS